MGAEVVERSRTNYFFEADLGLELLSPSVNVARTPARGTLYRRCAGLDIHKDSISACVRVRVGGKDEAEVLEERVGTFTQQLEHLGDWLKEHKVKQVAMESTGVYWIPIWNVLERAKYGLRLMLVNPAKVRALQGCPASPSRPTRTAKVRWSGKPDLIVPDGSVVVNVYLNTTK